MVGLKKDKPMDSSGLTNDQDTQSYYAIAHPSKPKHYLHANHWLKKGDEKWTTEHRLADKFISQKTAHNVAVRSVGANNFKIQKL